METAQELLAETFRLWKLLPRAEQEEFGSLVRSSVWCRPTHEVVVRLIRERVYAEKELAAMKERDERRAGKERNKGRNDIIREFMDRLTPGQIVKILQARGFDVELDEVKSAVNRERKKVKAAAQAERKKILAEIRKLEVINGSEKI